MFPQRRNRLTTHFSERIPVVNKWRMSVLQSTKCLLFFKYPYFLCKLVLTRTLPRSCTCDLCAGYCLVVCIDVVLLRSETLLGWCACAESRVGTRELLTQQGAAESKHGSVQSGCSFWRQFAMFCTPLVTNNILIRRCRWYLPPSAKPISYTWILAICQHYETCLLWFLFLAQS